LFLAVLFFVVAAGLVLLLFGPVSEEERVKAVILEAIEAAEDESSAGLDPLISPRYVGDYGASKSDLMGRVQRDFTLISDLSVNVTEWTIRIEGDRAMVDLKFHFRLIYDRLGPYSNVPITQLSPATPRGEPEQARLLLVREDGRWRIERIEVAIPPH